MSSADKFKTYSTYQYDNNTTICDEYDWNSMIKPCILLIAHPFTNIDNNENTMRYEFPRRPQ